MSMTRRDALKFGACGLLAASGTGAFGGGEKKLNAPIAGPGEDAGFPEAVFGKMSLKRVKVNVGATKPFSIVHATDSHVIQLSPQDFGVICEKNMDWYLSRREVFKDGIPGLAAAILYARKRGIPLFHTGDFFDMPSYGNLEMVKLWMKDLDFFYSPGNHEYHGWGPGVPAIPHGTSKEERDAGRKEYEAYFGQKFIFASRIINGVNFVQYDNGGFSDYYGCWQRDQMKKEFAKGLPVVVLCHMPFYTPEIVDWLLTDHKQLKGDRKNINCGYLQGVPWTNNWGGRLEMTEWLKKQPNLKAVICGHLHNEFFAPFSDSAFQYVGNANYKGAVYEYEFV